MGFLIRFLGKQLQENIPQRKLETFFFQSLA